MKAVITLAAVVFLGLFVAGSKAGWDRSHSDEAIVLASLPYAVVLPAGEREFVLGIACAESPSQRRLVYLQRVSDDAHVVRPSAQLLQRYRRTAARFADQAGTILSNQFVTGGVLGATGAEILKHRLSTMRNTIAMSRAGSLMKQRSWIAVVAIAAGAGYYLGDWIMGARPPACGSEDALEPFDRLENRRLLRTLVYHEDQSAKVDLLIRLAVPEVTHQLAQMNLNDLADRRIEAREYQELNLELLLLRINPTNADFFTLRQDCQRLRQSSGTLACTFLN